MRAENWPEILADHLAAARPFEWGVNDCCMFAADFVRAITGIDYAAKFRGRYTTERGAARALKRYGSGTLEATMDERLPRAPVALARRGDVVLYRFPTGDALGICNGERSHFVSIEHGLVGVPTLDCRGAWRVD